MEATEVQRRWSQTKAAQNPVMKKMIGEQTQQSRAQILGFFWLNIILNIAVTVLFLVFTISNVGDPQECYISPVNPNEASKFKPSPEATDWAKRFELWFITGIIISALNGLVYTCNTISKLRKDKAGHAIFQGAGCFVFCLTLGHIIWILTLRFRHSGRVVSGDFLEDGASEVERSNYLISHGTFALVYIILTAVVFVLTCIGSCVLACYVAAKTRQVEKS